MSEAHQRTEVFLKPGEWYFGGKEALIKTLLGSCVSITFWHPRLKVGGMCHYLLSQRKNAESTETFSGRYADEALLLLVREILRTGRSVREFHVKLIGGASVLSSLEREMNVADVPGENIAMARRLSKQLNLNVQAEDFGGSGARLVLFDVECGDVWVRQSNERDLPKVHHAHYHKKRTTT